MNYQLRIHQNELVNFFFQRLTMGVLGYHGMGLGKTLSGLDMARKLISYFRQQGYSGAKFVVFLPKSAIPAWKTECFHRTPEIYQAMIWVPYSQMHNFMKKAHMIDIRFLIFDESHYLKGQEIKRNRTLANLLRVIAQGPNRFSEGRILTLTGTPTPNGAHELYTSWALCCAPTLIEAANRLDDTHCYNQWKYNFAKAKESKWEGWDPNLKKKVIKKGTNFSGISNSEYLIQLMSMFVHFRRVSDCIDLPAKAEIPIDLGLPDDRLLADAKMEEENAYMAVLRQLSEAKTPHMLDWIEDFLANKNNIQIGDMGGDKEEQLVVFAMHRAPLEAIVERWPGISAMITGSEKEKERDKNFADFKSGKIRILALSYKCGSESYNLQNCRYSLYHGYPWTDGAVKQAIGRTYRQGQEHKSFHYFLTSGANDKRMLSLVRAKEEATTEIEDGLLKATKNMVIEVASPISNLISKLI